MEENDVRDIAGVGQTPFWNGDGQLRQAFAARRIDLQGAAACTARLGLIDRLSGLGDGQHPAVARAQGRGSSQKSLKRARSTLNLDVVYDGVALRPPMVRPEERIARASSLASPARPEAA